MTDDSATIYDLKNAARRFQTILEILRQSLLKGRNALIIFMSIVCYLFSNYELNEERGVLIARAFVGVDGPDTGRNRRSSAANKQVELGEGLAVYTTPRAIGVTYEVFN